MPFWQLYYHLVWATKRREPLEQRRNHAAGSVIPVLERTEPGEV